MTEREMPGKGFAPKDPARRARRNVDTNPSTVLRFERAEPHDLPDGYDWPQVTQRWFEYWRFSPQAEHFQHTDWEFLATTARIHAEVWSGNAPLAAELRLREAKLGATVEDRLRLRMSMADADEKDAKRPAPGTTARERYGDLRAVGE
jgi:transglutaminase-like putative cysteine protease